MGVYSGPNNRKPTEALAAARKGAETRVQRGKDSSIPPTPPEHLQGPLTEAQPRDACIETLLCQEPHLDSTLAYPRAQ